MRIDIRKGQNQVCNNKIILVKPICSSCLCLQWLHTVQFCQEQRDQKVQPEIFFSSLLRGNLNAILLNRCRHKYVNKEPVRKQSSTRFESKAQHAALIMASMRGPCFGESLLCPFPSVDTVLSHQGVLTNRVGRHHRLLTAPLIRRYLHLSSHLGRSSMLYIWGKLHGFNRPLTRGIFASINTYG